MAGLIQFPDGSFRGILQNGDPWGFASNGPQDSPYYGLNRQPAPQPVRNPATEVWENEGGPPAPEPRGVPLQQVPTPGRGVGVPPGYEPGGALVPYKSGLPGPVAPRGVAVPPVGGGGVGPFTGGVNGFQKLGPLIEGTLADQGGSSPLRTMGGGVGAFLAAMQPTPANPAVLQPGQPGSQHAPASDAFSGIAPSGQAQMPTVLQPGPSINDAIAALLQPVRQQLGQAIESPKPPMVGHNTHPTHDMLTGFLPEPQGPSALNNFLHNSGISMVGQGPYAPYQGPSQGVSAGHMMYNFLAPAFEGPAPQPVTHTQTSQPAAPVQTPQPAVRAQAPSPVAAAAAPVAAQGSGQGAAPRVGVPNTLQEALGQYVGGNPSRHAALVLSQVFGHPADPASRIMNSLLTEINQNYAMDVTRPGVTAADIDRANMERHNALTTLIPNALQSYMVRNMLGQGQAQ